MALLHCFTADFKDRALGSIFAKKKKSKRTYKTFCKKKNSEINCRVFMLSSIFSDTSNRKN